MLTEANNFANTALQCSGGKDSLATLFLMRPYWDQMTVAWVNTGAAYPETVALMNRVREWVPHFHEVKTDQPSSIERNGYPVDVVPIRNTNFGHGIEAGERIKTRPYFQCCAENIWEPMREWCSASGITTVIRGQRIAERMTTPIRSGHHEGGITYLHPIENWSDEDVFVYLESTDIGVPDHYEMTDSSLDCWNCTAFLHETGRQRWLKAYHPEKFAVSQQALRKINGAIESEMRYLRAALEL